MNAVLANHFTSQAARHLEHDLLPRIMLCLKQLSEEDLWWRPNSHSNSVGNLLWHLSGNVRQWIIAGLGGAADVRQRDAEFQATENASKAELGDLLSSTVAEAASVIRGLEEGHLLEKHHIQIYDVTGLQAIFHVVEHFSHHTGQIIYITKLRRDTDLAFYGELDDKKKRFRPTEA